MNKKVLFIVTSHDRLGDTGRKTGFWFEEVISPYYRFKDAGYEVTIATPNGGLAPIDPDSELPVDATEDTKRYHNDEMAKKAVENTVQLSKINGDDYAAIYYPGGYGPLFDLVDNPKSIQLIKDFYHFRKPVATVCHGSGVFKNVTLENGEALIKNRNITGFADSEEEAINMTSATPFLVESMLTKLGSNYSKAVDWQEHVVVDDILVSGQNPASSNGVANKVIELLKK